MLTLATGEERAGPDLRAIIDEARQVRQILDGLHSRYDRGVVEQAAIAGALNPELLSNDERGREAAAYIARRLDILVRRDGARLDRQLRASRPASSSSARCAA